MADHTMKIVTEEQRERGWYLAWRCTVRGCEAKGNVTAPSKTTARQLFGLVAEGHKRSEEVS